MAVPVVRVAPAPAVLVPVVALRVVPVLPAVAQADPVPAVAVLEEVGPNRLTVRLAEAGAALVLPRREAPGLALGLGGVGIRLEQHFIHLVHDLQKRDSLARVPSAQTRNPRAASSSFAAGRRLLRNGQSESHSLRGRAA